MASVGRFAEIQFLSIVLEKRAQYTPESAQVFGNQARIMLFSLNYAPRVQIMPLGFERNKG